MDLNSIVSTTQEQMSCELDGATVVLDLHQGVYCTLNSTGTVVWKTIQKPSVVGDIVRAVCDGYDVDVEQCTTDVIALIETMAAAGLVHVSDEPAP